MNNSVRLTLSRDKYMYEGIKASSFKLTLSSTVKPYCVVCARSVIDHRDMLRVRHAIAGGHVLQQHAA
jgi:hypothetical protein